MLKLLWKTKIIFLFQLLLYLTVPLMYYLMIRLAVHFNYIYLYWAPFNILLPAAIIAGLSLASVYSAGIVRILAWYINQALTVAATVIINGLDYRSSLTVYSIFS